MNAFTLWTKATYLRLENEYYAGLFPYNGDSKGIFAGYDNLCGKLYFNDTVKFYPINRRDA